MSGFFISSVSPLSGAAAATSYAHALSDHAPADAEENINADWDGIGDDSAILNKPPFLIPENITVPGATYALNVEGDKELFVFVEYTPTGPVTITIDTDMLARNQVIHIIDAGGNAGEYEISVLTEGAEKISGKASYIIDNDSDSVSLRSNGTHYFVF